DYLRFSKFSLVWMGYSVAELRHLRSASVGADSGKGSAAQEDRQIRTLMTDLNLRPRMRARDKAVLARYIDDMRRAIGEVARVLTPGGKAVYVVGENTIR